ncbi:MAG: hypothetical protein E7413_00930 [Ruminococcaceae bacterium]|nr:hypothetical protein [Oscillospiraceae bacterium]
MEKRYNFNIDFDKFVCPDCGRALQTRRAEFKLAKNYPLLRQFIDQGGVTMTFTTLCNHCKSLYRVYCLCRDVNNDVDVTVCKVEKI